MKQEERTIAALTHLLIIVPLWGILFAGIIWLNFKERSREVVFHAQQAIFFQCILLLIFLIGAVFSLFSELIKVFNQKLAQIMIKGNIWLLIICFAIYAAICIYAALLIIFGKDFNYPYVGKKLRRSMEE